jgi:hypothetical protein
MSPRANADGRKSVEGGLLCENGHVLESKLTDIMTIAVLYYGN